MWGCFSVRLSSCKVLWACHLLVRSSSCKVFFLCCFSSVWLSSFEEVFLCVHLSVNSYFCQFLFLSGCLHVRLSSCQVVFQSGYSYQVVFLSGCIPIRSSSCKVVFLSGRLPVRSLSVRIQVVSIINTNTHFTCFRLITDVSEWVAGYVGGWKVRLKLTQSSFSWGCNWAWQ